MHLQLRVVALVWALSSFAVSFGALATDQTVPGAGHADAEQIVVGTPRVLEHA